MVGHVNLNEWRDWLIPVHVTHIKVMYPLPVSRDKMATKLVSFGKLGFPKVFLINYSN